MAAPEENEEDDLALLDPSLKHEGPVLQCKPRSWAILAIVPFALVACIVVGVHPTLTMQTHGNDEVEFFNANRAAKEVYDEALDKLGMVPDGIATQVEDIRKAAKKARDNMHLWIKNKATSDRQAVVEYVTQLSDVSQDAEKAESDFVSLCSTVAQLLEIQGRNLKRKMLASEISGKQVDISDEKKLMKATVDVALKRFNKVEQTLISVKKQVARLGAVSEDMKDRVKAQLENWDRMDTDTQSNSVAAWAVSAAAGCSAAAGIASISTAGLATPLFIGCGAIGAVGAGASALSISTEYHNGITEMTRCLNQFSDIEGKCDSLESRLRKDINQLIDVQSDIQTLQVLMVADYKWRKEILPKNDRVVRKLRKVVTRFMKPDGP